MSKANPFETIDTKYRAKVGDEMNPLPAKDAQYQTTWLWMVGVYLFLGGVGSGAYVTGALAGLLDWPAALATMGLVLSFPLVGVGTLFLLAHLGRPANSMYAASKAGTSWISRGVIFISLFIGISVIHFALSIWPLTSIGADLGTPLQGLAVLGILAAVGTMV